MKKRISIFSFFSFILLSSHALAGTTTLTTYYPPPTAAYNQVKLSINYAAPPACNVSNSGTIYVDSSGTLHVCIFNPNTSSYQYSIYPQQCYNAFCSYDNSSDPGGNITCLNYLNANIVLGLKGVCQNGFVQTPVDSSLTKSDVFQASTKTYVISIVCCSS